MFVEETYSSYTKWYEGIKEKVLSEELVEITKELAIEMRERCGIGLMDAKCTLAE